MADEIAGLGATAVIVIEVRAWSYGCDSDRGEGLELRL